jgi:hypothetical protein
VEFNLLGPAGPWGPIALGMPGIPCGPAGPWAIFSLQNSTDSTKKPLNCPV